MKSVTETLNVRRKIFFTIANDSKEYVKSVVPTEDVIRRLRQRGVDLFTFLERKWCCPIAEPLKSWTRADDNVALLHLKSYHEWWQNVGKKTRNMIRKAEKMGIKTQVVEANEGLAEGMWRIYNETPIRQERGFSHYGVRLDIVKRNLLSTQNCTYIAAYFQNELAGFIQLVDGDRIIVISQILSLQKHLDKAVNNAMIAKAIEFCASKHVEWIMYGRIGNHPSLDKFKKNNGFVKFTLTRYFIPLTKKGRIATKLGLHREMKDALPKWIKNPLIPLYNWTSRTKMKIRLRLEHKTFA